MKTALHALAALALAAAPVASQWDVPAWLVAPGAAGRFSPAQTAYDETNAYLCTTLANMAYPGVVGMGSDSGSTFAQMQYRDRVTSILRGPALSIVNGTKVFSSGWGFPSVTHFRNGWTDTEGFVTSNRDYAVVSIRGSESTDALSFFQDWVQADFNVAPIAYDGTVVHLGFYQQMKSVAATVASQLRANHDFATFITVNGRRMLNPRAFRPIWICGHSLGGAVATLLAYELRRFHGLPVRGAYTTAAPMVGNAGFAAAYANRGLVLHRTTNNCDVVAIAFGDLPQLPQDLGNVAGALLGRVGVPLVEPVRTRFLQLLALITAPANAFAGQLSFVNTMLQNTGGNYVHFGNTHRYFNRAGNVVGNPSTTYRRNDRVQRYADLLEPLVRRFVPPSPPPAWDYWGQILYANRLLQIANDLLGVITNPLPFLGEVWGALDELFTDHFPMAYQDLAFRRMQALNVNMTGLPRQP